MLRVGGRSRREDKKGEAGRGGASRREENKGGVARYDSPCSNM
jgi:hypothetical protein